MTVRNWEAVTAHWNPRHEAVSFWVLIENGKCTVAQAEADILMSREVFDFLVREYPADRGAIEAIRSRREETWQNLMGIKAAREAMRQ